MATLSFRLDYNTMNKKVKDQIPVKINVSEKQEEIDALYDEILFLNEKISELESTVDVHSKDISIVNEVLNILDRLPLGHTLINRARNKAKLRYLKYVVLPRRKQLLHEIEKNGMPPNIVSGEEELISKVWKDISHREHFEMRSAKTVDKAFSRLSEVVSKTHESFLQKIIKHLPLHS